MSKRTTTTKARRAFAAVFESFAGNVGDLADALRLSRQGLWLTVRVQHQRVPLTTLTELANLLRVRGTIDGSPPPTREQLVRLWQAARAEVVRAEGGT